MAEMTAGQRIAARHCRHCGLSNAEVQKEMELGGIGCAHDLRTTGEWIAADIAPSKQADAIDKAVAEAREDYIDQNSTTCDCCQHVMIDVTASKDGVLQHCVAGDPEGEGAACAHGWHAGREQEIAEHDKKWHQERRARLDYEEIAETYGKQRDDLTQQLAAKEAEAAALREALRQAVLYLRSAQHIRQKTTGIARCERDGTVLLLGTADFLDTIANNCEVTAGNAEAALTSNAGEALLARLRAAEDRVGVLEESTEHLANKPADRIVLPRHPDGTIHFQLDLRVYRPPTALLGGVKGVRKGKKIPARMVHVSGVTIKGLRASDEADLLQALEECLRTLRSWQAPKLEAFIEELLRTEELRALEENRSWNGMRESEILKEVNRIWAARGDSVDEGRGVGGRGWVKNATVARALKSLKQAGLAWREGWRWRAANNVG